MFQEQPNPTFDLPVSGFVPGKPKDGLKVSYRHKTKSEYEAWVASFGADTLASRLYDVVAGWSDAPVPFEPGVIEKLAEAYPAFPQALFHTYANGLHVARLGN